MARGVRIAPKKTCKLVMSYPHLIEPQEFTVKPGEKPRLPRFSCVGIITPEEMKSQEYATMRAMAKEARDGFFKGNLPRGLRSPFRKCEEMWKEDPQTGKLIPEAGYVAGGEFINIDFGDKEKPDCRDQKMKEVTKASILYPGCVFIAVVTAGGYDREGNRGVKFYGKTLQKIMEGDNIAGRVNAEDYFKPVEDLGDNATTGATTGDGWDEDDDPESF